MSAEKKIKIMLVQRDMTMTDLAKELNVTATVSKKMKNDNFYKRI